MPHRQCRQVQGGEGGRLWDRPLQAQWQCRQAGQLPAALFTLLQPGHLHQGSDVQGADSSYAARCIYESLVVAVCCMITGDYIMSCRDQMYKVLTLPVQPAVSMRAL